MKQTKDDIIRARVASDLRQDFESKMKSVGKKPTDALREMVEAATAYIDENQSFPSEVNVVSRTALESLAQPSAASDSEEEGQARILALFDLEPDAFSNRYNELLEKSKITKLKNGSYGRDISANEFFELQVMNKLMERDARTQA